MPDVSPNRHLAFSKLDEFFLGLNGYVRIYDEIVNDIILFGSFLITIFFRTFMDLA